MCEKTDVYLAEYANIQAGFSNPVCIVSQISTCPSKKKYEKSVSSLTTPFRIVFSYLISVNLHFARLRCSVISNMLFK
jgi:hypothetical protein